MFGYLCCAILAILAWEAGRILQRAASPAPAEISAEVPVPAPVASAEVSALATGSLVGMGQTPAWEPPLQANDVSAGFDAFLYATRGWVHDTRHMTPAQRQWLVGLSDAYLAIVAGHLPARLDLHIAAKLMIKSLPAVRPIRPKPTLAEIAVAARTARD